MGIHDEPCIRCKAAMGLSLDLTNVQLQVLLQTLLKYIVGTLNYGIFYKPTIDELSGYCDSTGLEIVIPENQFLDIVFQLVLELFHGPVKNNQLWHYLQRRRNTKQA